MGWVHHRGIKQRNRQIGKRTKGMRRRASSFRFSVLCSVPFCSVPWFLALCSFDVPSFTYYNKVEKLKRQRVPPIERTNEQATHLQRKKIKKIKGDPA